MTRAMLHQLLWVCLILTAKVEARTEVTSEEKNGPFVNPYYDLCEQKQCLNIEDIFVKTVDLHVNPCDNYFDYACHATYTPSAGHFEFIPDPDNVVHELETILSSDKDIDKENQRNHALAIEKEIFKLCKSKDAFSDSEKNYYTQTILNSGPNRLLPDNDYEEEKNWEEADLHYGLKGFGFAFFQIDIYEETKSKNRRRYIRIKPPSDVDLQLQKFLDDYFRPKHGERRYSKTNPKYIKLENFMNELSKTLNQVEEKSSEIELIHLNKWKQEYGNQGFLRCSKIDWTNYLTKLFGLVRQTVSDNTLIAIQNNEYFSRLAQNLKKTDCDTILNFVHLRFVSKSVGLADPVYRDYSILPQIEGLTCTPGLLVGAAYKYADEYFSDENRKLLEDMVARVKNAVLARVQFAMDSMANSPNGSHPQRHFLTMNSFIEEYKNAEIYAEYPAWLMNGTIEHAIYGNVHAWRLSGRFYDVQARLIENILLTKLSAWKDKYMPIFDPMELSKGFKSNQIEIKSKTIVDSPQKTIKEIVIPFGYFNEKYYRFFSSQLFDPINYGAAATEIAFKLYYDLISKYEENFVVPKCVRDQVPSSIRDTETFMKKAIAYSLALEAAYESWPSKDSMPIQFVDFGAVPDGDLFFLSFAQSLCSVPAEGKRESQRPHFRMEEEDTFYRSNDSKTRFEYINFALRNSKPFRKNYMCTANQNMYRGEECDPFQI